MVYLHHISLKKSGNEIAPPVKPKPNYRPRIAVVAMQDHGFINFIGEEVPLTVRY